MCDFILFNLLRLVQNIQNKYNLPEKELNKLIKKLSIPNYQSYTAKFKIYYNQKTKSKYILLGKSKSSDYYYALKFD
tara:strand:+ start:1936 stop:2166 length:231 start_codon:yes stop_codon:yes gene_type:complete